MVVLVDIHNARFEDGMLYFNNLVAVQASMPWNLPINSAEEPRIEGYELELHSQVKAAGGKSHEPYPITMMQAGTGKSISSFYAGKEFLPVDGKIKLKISNTGRKEYKVLVVTVE
jgi:hypothetical protein